MQDNEGSLRRSLVIVPLNEDKPRRLFGGGSLQRAKGMLMLNTIWGMCTHTDAEFGWPTRKLSALKISQ